MLPLLWPSLLIKGRGIIKGLKDSSNKEGKEVDV
jgi:hypothetical protein